METFQENNAHRPGYQEQDFAGVYQDAFELKILKGISSYKEWTRRSQEIGKLIGGYIQTVNGTAAGNTANQQQKASRSSRGRYK